MSTRFHKTAVIASLLTGMLLLGGCSFIADYMNQGNATRDEETEEITEEGSLDIFTLKVGDCIDYALDSESATEISEIPVVPCADKHDQEVFFEFTLPEGEFPDEDTILAAAQEQCLPAFGEFVGVDFEQSTLDLSYFSPTQGSWDELDDRLVQCYVFDPAGQVMGTLEGAAR